MNENQPLVSIIVPTYNRAHCLKQALASVQAQDYKNWEFIISDDGSTDGTYDLALDLAKTESRVVVLPKAEKNQGSAVARNRAMTAAKGKYFTLLDSDDEWLQGKLSRQVAEFEAAPPNVGISFTGAKIIKNGGPRFALDIPEKEWEKDPLSMLAMWKLHFTTSTTMFKKECFEKVGGMQPLLLRGQDIEFFLRIFLAGYGLLSIQDIYTIMNLETIKTNLFYKVVRKKQFMLDNYYSKLLAMRGKKIANTFAFMENHGVVFTALRERHYLSAIKYYWRCLMISPWDVLRLIKSDIISFCVGVFTIFRKK